MAVCLARSRVFSAVENLLSFKRISLLRETNHAQGTVRDLLVCRGIHGGRSPNSFLHRFHARERNVRQSPLHKPSSRRWQSQDSSSSEAPLVSDKAKAALKWISAGCCLTAFGAFIVTSGTYKIFGRNTHTVRVLRLVARSVLAVSILQVLRGETMRVMRSRMNSPTLCWLFSTPGELGQR